MPFIKAIILASTFLAASVLGFSQKPDAPDGALFFGQNYSFTLNEPPGWSMDSETAKSQGLQAVLYPKGSSWKTAAAAMYVRVIYKNESKDTVEKVISNDISDFLQLSKESKVSDSPTLATRDRKAAIVKVFYDAANKNYESVAFID